MRGNGFRLSTEYSRPCISRNARSRRKPKTNCSKAGRYPSRESADYLSINKGKFITKISNRFGIPPSEAQSYARILVEDVARSQTDGIFTLYSIWKNLLFTGEVCSIHHQKNSAIPPDCSVCMDLHRPYRESGMSDDKESEDRYYPPRN